MATRSEATHRAHAVQKSQPKHEGTLSSCSNRQTFVELQNSAQEMSRTSTLMCSLPDIGMPTSSHASHTPTTFNLISRTHHARCGYFEECSRKNLMLNGGFIWCRSQCKRTMASRSRRVRGNEPRGFHYPDDRHTNYHVPCLGSLVFNCKHVHICILSHVAAEFHRWFISAGQSLYFLLSSTAVVDGLKVR